MYQPFRHMFRFARKPLATALSVAFAAGAAMPAGAASELDAVRLELEQQRKLLEQQQQVIDKLEKRLEKQAATASAPAPATAGSVPPVQSRMQVEIYGGLIPFAENVRASGATTTVPGDKPNQLAAAQYTGQNQDSRGRVTAGTSHIGFRGSIDVVEGYKATWQLEAGAAVDGESTGIGNTNVIGLRNSNVGFVSPYGAAFIGNWDTPYKYVSIPTVPLRGATTFDYNSIIGNPGFGVFGTTTQPGRANGKADAAFDRRQGNSIQYWTPTWNGFSGRAAYSLSEARSGTTAVPSITPKLWSVSAGYAAEPLFVQYAHEEHEDYFGMSQLGGAAVSATNRSSRDRGDKIVGMYSFKSTGTTLTGIYERLSYRNDDSGAAANVKRYERDAYVVGIQQKIGAGKAWVNYGKADDGDCSSVGGVKCVTKGLGATLWSVGYSHNLNRLVDVYAAYYAIDNDKSGTYQPVNSVNLPPNATPAPGLNIRGLGVGAVMLF